MSVSKHEYRAYTGRLTPLWARVAVVARYAMAEIWSSRIAVGLFTLSMLPFIVFLIGIFVANNPLARALIMRGNPFLEINANYFLKVLSFQCWIALAITAWVAPPLVTFDLADNALPILLSHPLSRFGYVMGKFIALFACLSLVTWVPCLILFAYQGYASSRPWALSNLQIAGGLLAGALLWIALLSILGLAVSSWVKWRPIGTAVIFGVVLVPAGVGGIVTGILRTRWGFLLNVPVMMTQSWQRLLGAPETMPDRFHLPTAAIAMVLAVVSMVCVVMLNVRIRAREVVRG